LKHSVKDVKLQIEREWESHPQPSDQRLVYAGKLLQDSSILEEVLRLSDARDENDAFTIHLVCRITKAKAKSEVRQRLVEQTKPESPSTQSAERPQQMSNPYPMANPEQAALMQQMYVNYINQYMQYLQSMGVTPNWPPTATQSLIEHTNQINEEARQVPAVFDPVAAAAVAGAVANNLPAEPAQPIVHQEVQQGQQQQQPIGDAANLGNAVMNAGGGAGGIAGAMEDEDDLNGGQRDILDWCYVVTRVLVLFSVVYFYSSLARFALAAGLGIIFYLYNNGFFGQRNDNNENQNAAVNEVRQVAGAAGGEANNPNPENPVENNAAEEENAAHAETPAPPPHVLNVMATFVTTFFTSLMPNDPQIV